MTDDEREKFRVGIEAFVNSPVERARVQDLFGRDNWNQLPKIQRSSLGREFRQAVDRGEFARIRTLRREDWGNKRNHQEYMRAQI